MVQAECTAMLTMLSPVVLTILVAACMTPFQALATADHNDDLRVSSSLFNGNYHSITPDRSPIKLTERKVTAEDVLNQIGKPLVAHPPRATASPTAAAVEQRQQKQVVVAAAARKPQVRQDAFSVAPTPHKWPELHEPDAESQPPKDDPSPSKLHNICRWISLQEMINISFDTGDVIIRDGLGQPCYIITMRAYIKWNDDAYFPLWSYRAHPEGSYKIDFLDDAMGTNGQASASASGGQRMPLNCSLLDSSGTSRGIAGTPQSQSQSHAHAQAQAQAQAQPQAQPQQPLMSVQRVKRAVFNEEITIQVSVCGYLVLRLTGDGTYLALGAISFYQDGNIFASHGDASPSSGGVSSSRSISGSKSSSSSSGGGSGSKSALKTPRERGRFQLTPSMQSKHLVFSTSGADGHHQGNGALIVMPAYSRYVCQNRIVLTGNNSVQLVLERFELQRLSQAAASGALIRSPNPDTAAAASTASTASPASPASPNNPHKRSRVERRQAVPVGVTASRSKQANWFLDQFVHLPLAVTRCPNPSAPGMALSLMMEPAASLPRLNNTTTTTTTDRWSSANKWASPASNHQSSWIRPATLTTGVGLVQLLSGLLVNIYLALCWAQRTMVLVATLTDNNNHPNNHH